MNQLAFLFLCFICLYVSPIVTAVELLRGFLDKIKASERCL
ncbi:MAG: hypothetical protein ACI87Q_001225, partial [Pseudohongiellaceae bacterium]